MTARAKMTTTIRAMTLPHTLPTLLSGTNKGRLATNLLAAHSWDNQSPAEVSLDVLLPVSNALKIRHIILRMLQGRRLRFPHDTEAPGLPQGRICGDRDRVRSHRCRYCRR